MASSHSLQVDTTYRQIIKLALPISFAMLIPQFNFVNHFFLAKNLLIVLNDSFVFIGVTHTAQCLRIKEVSWSCYLFVSKVINRIMFLTADFGRGDDQPQAVSASKSAVLSLLLSLHKQRK